MTTLGEVGGWLFLHTLWQVPLVAALLGLALWGRPSANTASRERCVLSALAIVLLAAGATGLTLLPERVDGLASEGAPPAAARFEQEAAAPIARASGVLAAVSDDGLERQRVAPPLLRAARDQLGTLLPWLGFGWLVLILIGLLRLVGGAHLIARALRRATPAPPHLAARFAAVAAKLGVARPPRLLVSREVSVPVVVARGPTVLLPADLGDVVSDDQLAPLMAHELEHVRRNDHRSALLLAVFDAVFVAHPGGRWITRTLRSVRELRCDAAAVVVAGETQSYARALLALVRASGNRVGRLGIAATDGSLLHRIQALLGVQSSRRRTGWVPPVLVVSAALLMAVALAALPPAAQVGFTPDGHGRSELAALIEPGDTWVWVTVIGPLRTDDAFESVTGVDPQGHVVFEERRADGWRRVVITQHGDEVRFAHVVNGSSVEFGDEARAWLSGILATDSLRRDLEKGSLGAWLDGLGWGTSVDLEARMFVSTVRLTADQTSRVATILDRQIESLRGDGYPGSRLIERDPERAFVHAAMTAHHLAAHGLISAEQLQAHLAELEALTFREVADRPPGPTDWEASAPVLEPGATWVWISTFGDLEVRDGAVLPAQVLGRVIVEERSLAAGARRYEARRDAAGALYESYRIAGREVPLDATGRARLAALVADPSTQHMLTHDERDWRGRLAPLRSSGHPLRSIVRLDVDGSRAKEFLSFDVARLSGRVPYIDLATTPRVEPPFEVRVSWSAFLARHLEAHGLIGTPELVEHLEALDAIPANDAP